MTREEINTLKEAVRLAHVHGVLTAEQIETVQRAQHLIWLMECALTPGLAHVPDHPRKVAALEELLRQTRANAGRHADVYCSVEKPAPSIYG